MCCVWQKMVAGAVLIACGLVATTSWGQIYGGMPGMKVVPKNGQMQGGNTYSQNPNQQQKQPVNFSGTIDSVGSRGMTVDVNGQKVLVSPDKNCRVEVTGTADASFLKTGMPVQFSAEFDKKGKATAAVNDLEVVSPTVQQQQKPRTLAEANQKKGAAAATAPAGGSTMVMGVLKAFNNNEMTVESQNGIVAASLSPNATIKINTNDARIAQQGDKIDIQGYATRPNSVIADNVKITLTKALGDPSKKPLSTKPASTTSAN